jgi:hypothetical protein
MNLVDSVKLLPGDRVEYAGDRQMTDEWIMEFRGTVVRVAPRGGILIHDDRGFDTWLAYNHVRRVEHIRRAGRPGPSRSTMSARCGISSNVSLSSGAAAPP